MSLDEATRRLMFLLQRDLRRLVERERSRVDREEEVRYDAITRMATWETKRGDVIGRWYGEVIASYLPADRILRWAWAGRASSSHAEVISREGQARGVPQLTMSVVGELDEEEAATLARLGALVARGEGVEVQRSTSSTGEVEVTFVGLFDSPRPREGPESNRYSVPPPEAKPVATAARSSRPPSDRPAPVSKPPPFRSLPPIQEIYAPRTTPKSVQPPPPAKIREPARSIFIPIASAVVDALSRALPGFQQAIYVVSVSGSRLAVTLVALDASGTLLALDPSQDLVDATARMIESDRADGNGPWRKLSARIKPKPDGGATLHVDVV